MPLAAPALWAVSGGTEVSPTDVKREEFGFMLANVSERGEFAATDAYIMSRMRTNSSGFPAKKKPSSPIQKK
mgnify:CR=1 FL=1